MCCSSPNIQRTKRAREGGGKTKWWKKAPPFLAGEKHAEAQHGALNPAFPLPVLSLSYICASRSLCSRAPWLSSRSNQVAVAMGNGSGGMEEEEEEERLKRKKRLLVRFITSITIIYLISKKTWKSRQSRLFDHVLSVRSPLSVFALCIPIVPRTRAMLQCVTLLICM